MLVRKKIITLLLICAYSIGFAHEMIPHFHVEDEIHNHLESSDEEHHHLDNHKHVNTNDGNNVAHQDHLDDSIYDYLVCLFSGVDHTTCYSSHEVSFPTFDLKVSENKSNKRFTIASTSFHFNGAEVTVSKVEIRAFDERIYLSPIEESDPNRGPPKFSC